MRRVASTIALVILTTVAAACSNLNSAEDLDSPRAIAGPMVLPSRNPVGSPNAASTGQILRLVLRRTADGIETLSTTTASGAIHRRDPHRASPYFFRVLERGDRVLLERGFHIADELRSEIQTEHGQIEGRRVPLDEPIFSIAIPLMPDVSAIRFYKAIAGQARDQAELIGEVHQ